MLPVIVGEQNTFVGDTIDIGCFVTHQTTGVGTDVTLTDIVAPDHQNIGLVSLRDARHGKADHQQGNQAYSKFVFNHRGYLKTNI